MNAWRSVHGIHFTFHSFHQQLQRCERWLLTSHAVIASWDTIWRKSLAPSSLGKWISFCLIKVNVTAWLERTTTNCVFWACHLLGVLLCKIKGELVFGSLFMSEVWNMAPVRLTMVISLYRICGYLNKGPSRLAQMPGRFGIIFQGTIILFYQVLSCFFLQHKKIFFTAWMKTWWIYRI